MPLDSQNSDRDISEKLRRQKRESEQILKLALTIKTSDKPVVATDTSDMILFMSEAALKLYGYKSLEIIGQPVAMLRAGDRDSEAVKNLLEETMQGGWKGELWQKRKDGSEFKISMSSSPVRDEETNAIIGLLGTFEEIPA